MRGGATEGGGWGGKGLGEIGKGGERGCEASIAAFVPWYQCCPQGETMPGSLTMIQ